MFDPHTGVVVTETSDAELVLQERIRSAQQDAVSEVLLPVPSPDLVHRIIEDAEGFAVALTAKHRDPNSPQVPAVKPLVLFSLIPPTLADMVRSDKPAMRSKQIK